MGVNGLTTASAAFIIGASLIAGAIVYSAGRYTVAPLHDFNVQSDQDNGLQMNNLAVMHDRWTGETWIAEESFYKSEDSGEIVPGGPMWQPIPFGRGLAKWDTSPVKPSFRPPAR